MLNHLVDLFNKPSEKLQTNQFEGLENDLTMVMMNQNQSHQMNESRGSHSNIGKLDIGLTIKESITVVNKDKSTNLPSLSKSKVYPACIRLGDEYQVSLPDLISPVNARTMIPELDTVVWSPYESSHHSISDDELELYLRRCRKVTLTDDQSLGLLTVCEYSLETANQQLKYVKPNRVGLSHLTRAYYERVIFMETEFKEEFDVLELAECPSKIIAHAFDQFYKNETFVCTSLVDLFIMNGLHSFSGEGQMLQRLKAKVNKKRIKLQHKQQLLREKQEKYEHFVEEKRANPKWCPYEIILLVGAYEEHGKEYEKIAQDLRTKDAMQVEQFCSRHREFLETICKMPDNKERYTYLSEYMQRPIRNASPPTNKIDPEGNEISEIGQQYEPTQIDSNYEKNDLTLVNEKNSSDESSMDEEVIYEAKIVEPLNSVIHWNSNLNGMTETSSSSSSSSISASSPPSNTSILSSICTINQSNIPQSQRVTNHDILLLSSQCEPSLDQSMNCHSMNESSFGSHLNAFHVSLPTTVHKPQCSTQMAIIYSPEPIYESSPVHFQTPSNTLTQANVPIPASTFIPKPIPNYTNFPVDSQTCTFTPTVAYSNTVADHAPRYTQVPQTFSYEETLPNCAQTPMYRPLPTYSHTLTNGPEGASTFTRISTNSRQYIPSYSLSTHTQSPTQQAQSSNQVPASWYSGLPYNSHPPKHEALSAYSNTPTYAQTHSNVHAPMPSQMSSHMHRPTYETCTCTPLHSRVPNPCYALSTHTPSYALTGDDYPEHAANQAPFYTQMQTYDN